MWSSETICEGESGNGDRLVTISGWIINAMHSREGCYTYVKEIVKGESYVELAEEEAEALDKAIFHDIEKIEKSEIIEK